GTVPRRRPTDLPARRSAAGWMRLGSWRLRHPTGCSAAPDQQQCCRPGELGYLPVPLIVPFSWGYAVKARLIACAPCCMGEADFLLVLAEHLGAQDVVVEVEHAVELAHSVRLAGQVENDVDALFLLLDRVLKAALAPDINLVDRALFLADNVQVLVQRWGYGALILGRIDDDHDFVLTHGPHHLLWSSVSAMLIWAWQEGRCVSNLASVPRCLRKWEIRDHSPRCSPRAPARPAWGRVIY